MPREVVVSSRAKEKEKGKACEYNSFRVASRIHDLNSIRTTSVAGGQNHNNENNTSLFTSADLSDGSPLPKPGFGSHRRAQVLVISDSDSDSDSLPSPSQLRFRSKIPVASGSGPKAAVHKDEIIDISSDSEVEVTPTKPRIGTRFPLVGKPNTTPRPAVPPARLLSTSPACLSETLKRTTLLDSPTRDEEPPIELECSEEDAPVARYVLCPQFYAGV